MTDLRSELKQFVITALELEDMSPDDIGDDLPLFGDGLGLDSIDALELGIALRKKYNLQLESGDTSIRNYFHNINTLAELVNTHRRTP
jgi:acyl carrier protein